VARRGYATRDETRAADVSLSNAHGELLGEAGHGLAVIEKIVEAGIAATAAETVGAMEAMNEMTLEYSKTRVQFGQPIGSYQVVQHRMADMFMAQEQGRSMAILATMSVDNPDAADRRHDFAMAKVGVGQAGRYVSQSAVQMHGGIGMTEEYAVGHYFRRCMVIERLFGDPAYYLQRLANEIT
jgi:alkylation response protein AidB-like acyl-CoA dehydrogenase